jgi:hypothetical protein
MTTATARRDGTAYRWDRPGIPHKGWSCSDVEDMGEPCFECELCGYPEVRFVHVMGHPEYAGELRVGCVCAGHLEGDYAAAKDRERGARNAAARRDRLAARHRRAREDWADLSRWRVSEKGNYSRRSPAGRVTLFPDRYRPGGWKAVIGDRFGSVSYAGPEDAALGTFARIFPLRRLQADRDSRGRSAARLPGERGYP